VTAGAVAARVSEVFHALMCTALIAMAWRSEPIAPTWFELALFGCAVIWFGLAGQGGVAGFQVCRLPGLHHALMAGAMIWMITAMPAASRMGPAGPARSAMPAMSPQAAPAAVLAVCVLLAAYFACRMIRIAGVEGGEAGVRELGVEAGGLMARAFVALPEKMGQLLGLATSWP